MNKRGWFAAACAAVACAFGANVTRAEALVPSGGLFRNNIVWGNSGVCELVKKGGSVGHCCYPEAEEGVNGNTAKDPLLKKGCVIRSCSPCRDAGEDRPWMAGAVDLRGNPRISDDRVDMGCFEVRPSGNMLIIR